MFSVVFSFIVIQYFPSKHCCTVLNVACMRLLLGVCSVQIINYAVLHNLQQSHTVKVL